MALCQFMDISLRNLLKFILAMEMQTNNAAIFVITAVSKLCFIISKDGWILALCKDVCLCVVLFLLTYL